MAKKALRNIILLDTYLLGCLAVYSIGTALSFRVKALTDEAPMTVSDNEFQ